MTRQDLHNELSKVLYIEDKNIVDVLIATVVANSLQIGDPVWLALVGASSAGKSQFIRPFLNSNSEVPDFFIKLDDLSASTLLSGNGADQSLLTKIGALGMFLMDDLTVINTKGSEERNAILSQFRMVYDGHMSKGTGKGKSVEWKGHAGMIAGSTPSIYRFFAEVADMGERFVLYRMKDMDVPKAMKFVNENGKSAKVTDEFINNLYKDYTSGLMKKLQTLPRIPLDPTTLQMIEEVSIAATKLRTPVIVDDRDHFVSEFVVKEMPFRVHKQLVNIGKAMMQMHFAETGEKELPDDLRTAIQWIGYSIADDKRRSFFNAVLALKDNMEFVTARNIAAYTGLNHRAVERGMSILSAIGVVEMTMEKQGHSSRKEWKVTDPLLEKIVRRIDPPRSTEGLLLEDEGDYEDTNPYPHG